MNLKTTKDKTTVMNDSNRVNLRLHDLYPAPGSKKKKLRVGRGEASKGKTSGRGTKGTKARNNVRIGFEGGQVPIHMRLPKLRGFTNPFRVEYQVVNLDTLKDFFPDGGSVECADLIRKGIVRKGQLIKLLARGEITASYDIRVDAWSKSAEEKVISAGGTLSKK